MVDHGFGKAAIKVAVIPDSDLQHIPIIRSKYQVQREKAWRVKSSHNCFQKYCGSLPSGSLAGDGLAYALVGSTKWSW